MNRFLRGTAALALVLGLAGCAAGTEMGAALSQAGAGIASGFDSLTSGELFGDGYLADESDVCFRQRQAMAEHGSYFDKQLVLATVGGAMAGGLLAALTGENVIAGAAIGGAVGLASGYLLKLQQESVSAHRIVGQVASDVETENGRINALLVSFRALKECRMGEGHAIQRAYSRGTIDKAAARKRMTAARQSYREDVAKFEEIAGQISENSQAYATAYNEIAADNGTARLQVHEPPDERATAKGSLHVDNKRIVKKLRNECLTNVRKRDECIETIRESREDTDQLQLDLA